MSGYGGDRYRLADACSGTAAPPRQAPFRRPDPRTTHHAADGDYAPELFTMLAGYMSDFVKRHDAGSAAGAHETRAGARGKRVSSGGIE